MRYLGQISGEGTLQCGGADIGRASYDFDGFLRPPTGVSSSGEIHLAHAVLKGIFGRPDIRLLTDDGRLLALRFSEKALPALADVAHVEVTGDLPAGPAQWRH